MTLSYRGALLLSLLQSGFCFYFSLSSKLSFSLSVYHYLTNVLMVEVSLSPCPIPICPMLIPYLSFSLSLSPHHPLSHTCTLTSAHAYPFNLSICAMSSRVLWSLECSRAVTSLIILYLSLCSLFLWTTLRPLRLILSLFTALSFTQTTVASQESQCNC